VDADRIADRVVDHRSVGEKAPSGVVVHVIAVSAALLVAGDRDLLELVRLQVVAQRTDSVRRLEQLDLIVINT
jgi:hypothetical protein